MFLQEGSKEVFKNFTFSYKCENISLFLVNTIKLRKIKKSRVLALRVSLHQLLL